MECSTDQAMYQPGAQVLCTVTGIPEASRQVTITIHHLETITQRFCFPVQGQQNVYSLSLPKTDFTGYLLRVLAQDEAGVLLATTFTAVDCSSHWTHFPRYGYVWDFTAGTDTEKIMKLLTRYHLNGIQFYDWQYRHHQPVSPELAAWTDWSGRVIDGGVLRACLDAAHRRSIACMAYNMIYAANRTYLSDGSGVQPAWRLVKADGQDFTCDMDASLGDVGVLQYFNICDPAWQRYIFAKENEVFQAFAFDGWHGDTIGENGPMTTADGMPLGISDSGEPIHRVKDGYTAFLNAAKQAIGNHWLAFNPVGAQGMENVNRSHVDVLYTEFWPWDKDSDGLPYDGYYSLHKAIRQAKEQSKGKSLIVAAYVNYRNPQNTFNPAAVRLLDSVVFASGGARIELGNGDGMLSDEYFPADRNKRMDNALQAQVQKLYDFMVAYENLLRDGQTPIKRTVRIEDAPVTDDGQANTVWCFATADSQHEIYHLINLMGTDADWRDEAQTKHEPIPLQNAVVTLHTGFDAQAVYLASPDRDDLSAIEIPFTQSTGTDGAHLTFTMPRLDYWNLIFLR